MELPSWPPPPLSSEMLPQGFLATGFSGGIKSSGRPDVSLVVSKLAAESAGVFTTNYVSAAPVGLSRKHLQSHSDRIRAVLVTSGNANAATGPQGISVAKELCASVASTIGCEPEAILIGQTGLIGIPLSSDKIIPKVVTNIGELGETPLHWSSAARGMMTTDTHPKWCSVTSEIDGKEVKILGIAKGVAMAHPAMATVIISLFTDAAMSSEVASHILLEAVSSSFHALSIDGCQSTNDSVFLLANGAAGNSKICDTDNKGVSVLLAAFHKVCRTLAIYMAQDAEGANKLLICRVNGARSKQEATQIARKVVGSVLVKCAIAGECAYWGRVIAEVGAAGIPVNPDKISISFGSYLVCKNGFAHNHDKEGVAKYMRDNTILITVSLEDGDNKGEAFGCDLTHEYLKINMEKS